MCEILSQCNSSNFCIVHQKRRDATLNDCVEEMNDVDVENKMFSNTANDPLVFHESLNVLTLNNITEVEKFYTENVDTLSMQFGVLLFLYSVIVTKVSTEFEKNIYVCHNKY